MHRGGGTGGWEAGRGWEVALLTRAGPFIVETKIGWAHVVRCCHSSSCSDALDFTAALVIVVLCGFITALVLVTVCGATTALVVMFCNLTTALGVMFCSLTTALAIVFVLCGVTTRRALVILCGATAALALIVFYDIYHSSS